uniref:Protein3 n=1 Tax=Alternaria solani chrysovirus 1 TaxID=2870620 RepID=A0A8K1JYV6_9VIRU|nr:protein3 [Alternaria solani chrysovirus 1]
MSNFNSVFEYMKDASSNLAHERVFSTSLLRGEGEVEIKDLVASEWKTLKTTEMNILSGMSCQMKFTRNRMVVDGLDMDFTAVGRGSTNLGQSELVNSERKTVRFDSDVDWMLSARMSKLIYSQRDSPDLASDSSLVGRITSACANLSSLELRGATISHALERITQKPDMKHMFAKMYLMLMDLNLAATSKSTTRRVVPRMPKCLANNVDDNRRLGAVMSSNVVVDADMLTGDEIELLALSALEYPSVKFCEDNVYNAIHMKADDLKILSSNNAVHMSRMNWVPDSLHRTIISLACKLDVVDDWFEVAGMMRGRPHLMREVMRRTQDRVVQMDICLSNSHNTAFGTGGRIKNIPKNYPGYLSTSVSLIADALLGQALHNGSSCLVEKVGGYGEMMCRGNPATDAMYQSLLREYGVSTMSMETNALLITWCQILEVPNFGWAMPIGWKEYITSLTDEMRNGNDVEFPQVLFDCAYIMMDDSAWGITRGWRGLGACTISDMENDKNLRDESIKKTAAFLWQMGVRKTRPKAFVNTAKTGEDRLSGREYKFLSGSEGGYTMKWLRYTVADDVGGRVDRTEEEASELIGTYFKGTRCCVMYTDTSGWVVKTFKGPEVPGVKESMGITDEGIFVPPEEDEDEEGDDMITPVMYGGSKVEKDKNVFKKLTAVYKPKVIITKKPEPAARVTIEPNSILAFNVNKVIGDGSCGIHAMVEGMKDRGMITETQKKDVFRELSTRTVSKSMHETDDLARVAMNVGCGLRVIDKASRVVHEYGTGDESNVLNLVRNGMHFDAAVIDTGGTERIMVSGVNRGEPTPEGGLAAMSEIMSAMPRRGELDEW